MKRIAFAALAAATFAAPLALASPVAADPPRHSRGWDNDHRNDRYDRSDRRAERRDDRRNYRDGYRDGRRADRWDDRRYNGYWRQGRFYYGPPPRHYNDVRYDYRQWRRGDRLPSYYRDRYRDVDYRRYNLRPPPRGYHYVRRDDTGEMLLIGIATGAILGVILAGS